METSANGNKLSDGLNGDKEDQKQEIIPEAVKNKEEEDIIETEKAVKSVISSEHGSHVEELESISSTVSSELSTPNDHNAGETSAVTLPTNEVSAPAIDTSPPIDVKPVLDYKCLLPFPPTKLDLEEQDIYPENVPPGLKKPYGVDVVDGKWMATCNRSSVGDIHGQNRDVKRFGPCPLVEIYKNKEVKKKIYCIPWWTDPGVFNMDVAPQWSDTLQQYCYRIRWKSKSDYDFVWYPERNLIWAAPRGKFDEELKLDAAAKTGTRHSDRVLQDLLPNGHRLSICQRMCKDDLILYGGRIYRIFENRTTDYGLYCVLADDYGVYQSPDDVPLTSNDCSFFYYTSLDRPNIAFAKAHKTVHWQREKGRDRFKGGRSKIIKNPFQQLLDAAQALGMDNSTVSGTVESVATGSGSESHFMQPSPIKRKRKRRASGDTTQSSIATPSNSDRQLDMDLKPSYDELEIEVHRCHKLLAENGIETETYKSAAEISHNNAIEAAKLLVKERLKIEEASNTLVLSGQQLNSFMEASNVLQEQYQQLARNNLMYMFSTVQNRLFGQPPPLIQPESSLVPPRSHETPIRPAYPSSVLADALGSAEKERVAKARECDKVKAKLVSNFSQIQTSIPQSRNQNNPSTIRTVDGMDVLLQTQNLCAVNTHNVVAVPVGNSFDVNVLAKHAETAIQGSPKTGNVVIVDSQKASDLQLTAAQKLAKDQRVAENVAKLAKRKSTQLTSVAQKRLSQDSPKPGTPKPNTPNPNSPMSNEDEDSTNDIRLLQSSFIEPALPESTDATEPLPDWSQDLFAYGLNEFAMGVKGKWLKPTDKDYWKIVIEDEIKKFRNKGGPDWGQKEPMINEPTVIDCNTRSNVYKFLTPLLIKACRQINLAAGLKWTAGKTKNHRNSDTHVRNALKYLFGKMWETNRPPEIATFEQVRHMFTRTLYLMDNYPSETPTIAQQMITLKISPVLEACVLAALNLGIPFRPKVNSKSICALVRELKVNYINKYKLKEEIHTDAMMSADLQSMPNYLPPKQYSPFEFNSVQRAKVKKDVDTFKKNRVEFDKTFAKGPMKKVVSKRIVKEEPSTSEVVEPIKKQAKLDASAVTEVIKIVDSPPKPKAKRGPKPKPKANTPSTAVIPKPVATKTLSTDQATKKLAKNTPKDDVMDMDLDELRAYALVQQQKLVPPAKYLQQFKALQFKQRPEKRKPQQETSMISKNDPDFEPENKVSKSSAALAIEVESLNDDDDEETESNDNGDEAIKEEVEEIEEAQEGGINDEGNDFDQNEEAIIDEVVEGINDDEDGEDEGDSDGEDYGDVSDPEPT